MKPKERYATVHKEIMFQLQINYHCQDQHQF